MNALAAESDAEVSQVLRVYRNFSRDFTHSPDRKPIPSIRGWWWWALGVWGGGSRGVVGAITQRNRNPTESWRVYCASLTQPSTYLIILIKLISGEPGRARALRWTITKPLHSFPGNFRSLASITASSPSTRGSWKFASWEVWVGGSWVGCTVACGTCQTEHCTGNIVINTCSIQLRFNISHLSYTSEGKINKLSFSEEECWGVIRLSLLMDYSTLLVKCL